MEKKFHISPKTGGPARCTALFKNCQYGEHYGSASEAQSAVEAEALRSAQSLLPPVSSKPRKPSVPLGEPRVSEEKIGKGYHYQEVWARDESGMPSIYAKLNLVSWGPEGERPGVVLCDFEINPAARGRGYPLEFFRKLKAEHGAESIELTGTLSEDGYRMYLRMKEHEAQTGEKIFTIQHTETLKEPHSGDSYSFVEDWSKELGKYQL